MPKGVNEHKWDDAKTLAKREGKENDLAYVSEIYKRIGGTFSHKFKKSSDLDPMEQEAVDDWVKKYPHLEGLHPRVILGHIRNTYAQQQEERNKALYDNSVKKSQHLDDAARKKIASMYRSNPSKWSVRSLADHLGYTRHQVAAVVKNLPQNSKTEEHIRTKQHSRAKWLGKKLPSHIVEASHRGRNVSIENRPATTLEVPVAAWLKKHGIEFKKQVPVEKLVPGTGPDNGIVDYYIPSKKMVLEANGPTHRLDSIVARDKRKYSILRSHGYKVVTIDDHKAQIGDLDNWLKQLL